MSANVLNETDRCGSMERVVQFGEFFMYIGIQFAMVGLQGRCPDE